MTNRRSSMAVILGFCFALGGCSSRKEGSSIKKKEIMSNNLTLEESQLLSDIKQRRENFTGKRLKISNRVLSDVVRYRNFTWENTDFENCDFIGCSMFDGILKNINFLNCMFYEVRWDGGRWDDVNFRDCAWSGAFDMGVSDGRGTLSFENCEFIGSTKEELGYGSKSDYFGGVGGTDGKVSYRKCKFERTYINGGRSTLIHDCEFRNVVISGQPESTLTLDLVKAVELVDIGSGKFSEVSIKDSIFSSRLTFNHTTMRQAVFQDVSANFDLTMVKAGSIHMNRVVFSGPSTPQPDFQYGLTSESAKISSLMIDGCSFGSEGAALYLSGDDTTEQGGGEDFKNKSVSYLTEIGDLTIRKTPVVNGQFRYMKINRLLLESLAINGADFSSSTIDNLSTRDVTSAKNLNFRNTVIKKKDTEILS